jgi:hypothetical protein
MHNKYIAQVVMASVLAVFAGCIHTRTAMVIDRSETSTVLKHCALEEYPYFKVVLGGAVHEIPLSDVRMLKIDPGTSIVFEREMYYAAEVILKDGSVLSQSGKANTTTQGQCYVAINNTLTGKRNKETFRIPLQNVVQFKYEQ